MQPSHAAIVSNTMGYSSGEIEHTSLLPPVSEKTQMSTH